VAYKESGMKPRLRDHEAPAKVQAMIRALGGSGNIVKVEPCAQTRLRVVINDAQIIDREMLATAGIGGVMNVNETTVHLLAGLNADQYGNEMQGQLAALRQQ
jgi:PTS system glucose-specific IIC component